MAVSRRGTAGRTRAGFAFDRRASGLLMHVTSLPGPHGSGDLSAEAHRFVDFCADAGQGLWQMLPVGPPGGPPGNSPYSSHSSAAGSPYLVSLEGLARDGLLSRRDLRPPTHKRGHSHLSASNKCECPPFLGRGEHICRSSAARGPGWWVESGGAAGPGATRRRGTRRTVWERTNVGRREPPLAEGVVGFLHPAAGTRPGAPRTGRRPPVR